MSGKIAGVVSILFLAVALYVLFALDPNDLVHVEQEVGLWGLAIIGVLILATQICAPFSGVPGLLISIRVYGLTLSLCMFYFVCMTSAATNFWIARVYGRRIVVRLVGQRAMAEAEDFVVANDRTVLLVSRLFGFYLFDSLSYALGLTGIPFARYYLSTAVFTLPPLVLQLYVLRYFDFQTVGGVVVYYAFFVGSGLVVAYLFRIVSAGFRKRRVGPEPDRKPDDKL